MASFFLIAVWVGKPLEGAMGAKIRLSVLFGAVALLLVADLRRSRQGEICSLGPRRQTPKRFGYRPYGTALWGLDTGLPFTTYRTTPLPLLGILLVALGFGSPWIGLAYAAGFLGSLLVSCAWPKSQRMRNRERHDPRLQGPLQIVQALESQTSRIRTASLVFGAGLMLWVALQALALL